MILDTPQPPSPIIVKVIEVPAQTLGDVVLSAIGFSGVVALVGALLGVLLGAAIIVIRIRQRRPSGLSSATADTGEFP